MVLLVSPVQASGAMHTLVTKDWCGRNTGSTDSLSDDTGYASEIQATAMSVNKVGSHLGWTN